MLNGLDLFSGIGGISLALGEWVQPVAYCENDRYAQAVLLSRMGEGFIGSAPIWDDIRTLRGDAFMDKGTSVIDIVYGGFPCQDISVAGAGAGLGGKRSGLFFEVIRLVSELRPSFVFLENVPAITVRGLDRVLMEFVAIGYDCRWTIVSAAEVGAHHERARWFLLAHARRKSQWMDESKGRLKNINVAQTLETWTPTDADGAGVAFGRKQIGLESQKPFSLDLLEGNNWDEYATFLRRVDNGVSNRGHRIRALGNSVVPLQARVAFQRLIGIGG